MAEQRFRPLRPACQKNKYYVDYFTDSTPEFCERLAKSFVTLLGEKHTLESDKWWSQEVKNLSDPEIQELLTRIVLERPCNVTIEELQNAFEKLTPTKAIQTHFKRLWDVLNLQDSNPADTTKRPRRRRSYAIQDNDNLKPALTAQSLPTSFIIPDQGSYFLLQPYSPWGVWPSTERQPLLHHHHLFLMDPRFPSPTMTSYTSDLSEYMPQPVDFHGPV